MLVVAAGDARIDNQKFRARFDRKARMLPRDQMVEIVGYEAGGVPSTQRRMQIRHGEAPPTMDH